MLLTGTPVKSACKCLLSYLSSLPEPLILQESAQLLREVFVIDNEEYQAFSIRCIIQATFPYNHRVVFQLLASLFSKMRDSGCDLEKVLSDVSVCMFPPGRQINDQEIEKQKVTFLFKVSMTQKDQNVNSC